MLHFGKHFASALFITHSLHLETENVIYGVHSFYAFICYLLFVFSPSSVRAVFLVTPS